MTTGDAAARRADAAERLRHDLGRAIRFSAPETPEADAALRERLARDVLATRSGPDGPLTAWAIFEAWRVEAGRHFESTGPWTACLARIASAADEALSLGSRLERLDRPELDRLDALTRAIAQDCRKLASAARGAKP